MYPTSVPTHSEEIGTSSSSTEATLTTGDGGAVAAPDLSPQPASATASTMASRRPPAGESFLISIVCTTQPPRGRPACLPRQWRPGIRRDRGASIRLFCVLVFRWGEDGRRYGRVGISAFFARPVQHRTGRLRVRAPASGRKVFAVDRPERLGLLEWRKASEKAWTKAGATRSLLKMTYRSFLEAAGRQRLDLAFEAQRSDQPHPVEWWPCRTPASASIRTRWISSSAPSSPRSPAAWVWGSRSAGRSSKRMADGSGRPRTRVTAPPSTSCCLRCDDERYPSFGGFEPLPAGVMPSRDAKRTRSATEPACIFVITCARCSLTVASLVPSSAAICLLRRPATMRASTSRSRGVRDT